jgi:hypothetical protein
MNSTRYNLSCLVRPAGIAGVVTAAILLVNAAKRSGLIATTDVTQLVAPVAQLAAIVFLLGLLAWAPPTRLRTGVVVTNVVVLAALVGVEVAINLVFAQVGDAVTSELRSGPLGVLLTVASVSFLLASLALVAAYWTAGAARWPLLVYGVGTVPVALRAAVPDALLNAGLVLMAAGVLALAVRLVAVPTRVDGPVVPAV